MEQTRRLWHEQQEDLEVLSEDGERRFCRGWRHSADGVRSPALFTILIAQRPSPDAVDRLAREYSLKALLDPAWAVRPVQLTEDGLRHVLEFEDMGGEPLERLIGAPLETGQFLRLAIGMATALDRAHDCGLVHKDVKPAHVMVNCADGHTRLTGFGIASRLARERQSPEPPESIAGTLAYVAPEQTGRMNRSIDSRSDLYALGGTFYQMLTGNLPFSAADPMEWVHCHIARKPPPPVERLQSIPVPISNIVMKLLAKRGEERYQSAAGLERDLRRCLLDWNSRQEIDDFLPGVHDLPHRLLIPEKLYGRERDVDQMLAAFKRVVDSGAPELVLVSGYSGIGKSSVVKELHAALVPPRGLFASGKFDQYKRDIPYSPLAQAFQNLARSLLGKSEAELARWRLALRNALDPNGRLVTDLVPELALIIGEQPPVPALDSSQAKGRFQLVLRRFIGVFATAEHPLVLFLDDLQWLDLATLDLIEDLLMRGDVQHLLLIGAYRDNEVDERHALSRRLATLGESGAKVSEINLGPLGSEHVRQLTADALHTSPVEAAPLSNLVHAKTAGNPFFVLQFLHALADEGLLAFDPRRQRRSWNLDRIQAKGYADNVAHLMTAKLIRLKTDTQRALQDLACLGNFADIATLAIVLAISQDQVHAALWEAVRLELLTRVSGGYKFVHDRVQEAAYSLIPSASRAATHLRIGRLLAAHRTLDRRNDAIFDVVNHLNRGASLIDSPQERERLAELNLIAGRRAKESTAYASALEYFAAGTALLPDDAWAGRHDLLFRLELHRAESELLTGATEDSQRRLEMLSRRAENSVDRAAVACLRIDAHINLDQLGDAVGIGLAYLRPLGLNWSARPTKAQARREFDRLRVRLGPDGIRNPVELPLMTDPGALATLDVLVKVMAAAIYMDSNLTLLLVCQAVDLCLNRGNSDASCIAYIFLSMVAGRFGDYQAARRFGDIGYDLVEVRNLTRFQARSYVDFASLAWIRHVRACCDIARKAFEVGNDRGDVIYAVHACWVVITNRIAAGDPLADVQREAEAGLAFARDMRFGFVIGILTAQLALIRTLRGLTPQFGSFEDSHCNDLGIEGRFSGNPSMARVECWYWVRKLQARFLAGDYETALQASARAQPLLWTSWANFEAAEYHFYSALSRAATLTSGKHAPDLKTLRAHRSQLSSLAEHCPENFEDRAVLVDAEIARIRGDDRQAMDLYERAIRAAGQSGFIHNQALANELAARFYAQRGFEKTAQIYLRDARYGYLRWGAEGKVRQLDAQHPQLPREVLTLGPTSTMEAPVDHLDLATVIRVSQAVSGEIVLDKLIHSLMCTAIEHAGAQRSLLLLAHGAEYQIEAEATTGSDAVHVTLRQAQVSSAELPESVFRYAVRARESVLLRDASGDSRFADDEYICQRLSRSVLCLPLINQTRVIGVLYLENELSTDVFTPARISILELLASGAAMSLENSRLYRDLQEREARVRRLFNANIIGIFTWGLDGSIVDANDAFLRIVGYDTVDLTSGSMRWKNLMPSEWDEGDDRIMAELLATRVAPPFEAEYVRKDGSRVPVLIGAALFDATPTEGVAFVLDLSDRKRAEEAARDSVRRLHEVQMQLDDANRVASIAELSAAIAHELNQPLSGILTNASTCLRMLSATIPEIVGASETARRTIRDANRASEVITRLRALFSKKETSIEWLDLNEAAREVLALSSKALQEICVNVRSEFAEDLPSVAGDRVQLQQVILNLVRNAIDAMSGVGDRVRQLSISTRRGEDDQVLLTVQDTGEGLDPGRTEKLFEAFYTTKRDGMGMGLSLSRSIIASHDGRLWATPNDGPGATFSFSIPRRREGANIVRGRFDGADSNL